jgi:hypothetical protein
LDFGTLDIGRWASESDFVILDFGLWIIEF